MNEDIDAIPFYPVNNHNYSQFFKPISFNGKTLNRNQCKSLVKVIDEVLAQCKIGLPMMYNRMKEIENEEGPFYEIERTINSVSLFITMTMADCLVASKYFLLADTDYERRYMRGKLKIILNEGFKRLYGFMGNKNRKKDDLPEWFRLQHVMDYFPQVIRKQYMELTSLLEIQSRKSTWWKEERNLEVHLDAMKLYESRNIEIIESKVMIETLDLFDSLDAVDNFLENANACVVNYLKQKYLRGELSTE